MVNETGGNIYFSLIPEEKQKRKDTELVLSMIKEGSEEALKKLAHAFVFIGDVEKKFNSLFRVRNLREERAIWNAIKGI